MMSLGHPDTGLTLGARRNNSRASTTSAVDCSLIKLLGTLSTRIMANTIIMTMAANSIASLNALGSSSEMVGITGELRPGMSSEIHPVRIKNAVVSKQQHK